ncbi:MAG: hypothetical protein ABI639_06265 [Thermoanaerobaculia bacterium]
MTVETWNEKRPKEQIAGVAEMLDVPKPVLAELWLATLERLRGRLDASGASLCFAPVHFTWYHQTHREYLNVVETSAWAERLRGVETDVICLIDDLHDVYARLRKLGQIYGRPLFPHPQSSLRGDAFERHLRILDWRARELAATEDLARALRRPLTVLSTKHQPSVLARIAHGEPQAYFSHPISEPRRLARDHSEATREQARCLQQYMWDLQACLAQSVALLQPTCIDEFRLEISDGSVSLEPRFYARSQYSTSLFSTEGLLEDDVVWDGLTQVQRDGASDRDRLICANHALMVKSFIENQVTARDLQLVTQAHDLVVFRPRFNGNLSGGVRKEIVYFKALEKAFPGTRGKIILIDSAEDERRFFPRQFLEAVAAVPPADWSIRIQQEAVPALTDRLTGRTEAAVSDARARPSLESMRYALRVLLEEIGHDPAFQLSASHALTPLGDRGTYTQDLREEEELYTRRLLPALVRLAGC